MSHQSNSAAGVIDIWGVGLSESHLTEVELAYLTALPAELPSVEWVWAEMDRVWRSMDLDNRKPLRHQPVGDFYAHPVWLMNGVFSAADPISARHREAIAKYIVASGARSIADYGSGFGELTRQIAEAVEDESAEIWNIEPFVRAAAVDRLAAYPNIKWADRFPDTPMDVAVAQDVLEHVDDPLKLAVEISSAVRPGGLVIFANNFTPCILCHLPATFGYRRVFPWAMRVLGLRPLGAVDGASHALVFKTPQKLRASWLMTAEPALRIAGRIVNGLVDLRGVVRTVMRSVSNRIGRIRGTGR